MNEYWYCLLSKVIACAGFVALVYQGSPWLGALCILFAAYDPGKEQGE